MFLDLEYFVRVHQVSTFSMLDYVHIWHGLYKWLGMNTTKFFFGKVLKFNYVSGLGIILDLEYFVRVHQVSTFSTLDYVRIWHGAYKWLGMNTTKKFFGKMLKFNYVLGLRIILHPAYL